MKNNILIILLVFPTLGYCQADANRASQFNAKNKVAINGYDPVSYFDGKPAEGETRFQQNYRGVIYYFASSTNADKFRANPGKYEPAYGGWCAYAMGATGEKVKVDPETFKIIDGKVYLFYNFWTNNTLDDWNENEHSLREAANRNWSNFIR